MKKAAFVVACLVLFSALALAAYSGGSSNTPQPVYKPPAPSPAPKPEPKPVEAPKAEAPKAQPPAEPSEPMEAAGPDPTKLKCADPSNVVDRVKCRLHLSDEELSATDAGGETEIYFLPEECRPLEGAARGQCVSKYAQVQTCWRFEGGVREECIKKRVGLHEKSSVRDEKLACSDDACRGQLREKVFSLVKFRFYSVEDKAAQLLRKGVSEQSVADFIAAMEQQKLDFNAAATIDEKKQVLREASKLWKSFKAEAYKQLKGNQ